jgi:outer membrane lipoprotein-sorting protein
VPSVNRHSPRFAVIALCGLLLVGAVSGCSTTQEKAEIQQARAKHILDARAERQKHRHDESKNGKPGKQDEKGSKSQ